MHNKLDEKTKKGCLDEKKNSWQQEEKICIGLLFVSVIVLPVTWVMTGFAGEYDRWQIA
ncbi:MAG: hypothetical protein UHN47_10495 [Lachnospiraceae bacterium]|nr:hypothetical protein [Lachnospiraceae bacterium]